MFQWSNKINKSISFDQQELSDQALLSAIETELARYPYKTFGDVCKEALKAVLIPEFAQSSPRARELEQKLTELQKQFAQLEQHFLTKERESGRLDLLERQVQHLTFQLAQLGANPTAVLPSELSVQSPLQSPLQSPGQSPPEAAAVVEEEIDPILSHLSAIADDF